MSIDHYWFQVTVPSQAKLEAMFHELPRARVADLLERPRAYNMEHDHAPDNLLLSLEDIKATDSKGTAIRPCEPEDSDDERHLEVDPGLLAFAGLHDLGESGTFVALTQEVYVERKEWFWPLTGPVEPHSRDKPVDQLAEGDHILVVFPYKPEMVVSALLVVPTDEDAGNLTMGLSSADQETLIRRRLMPETWVLETMVKGLLGIK